MAQHGAVLLKRTAKFPNNVRKGEGFAMPRSEAAQMTPSSDCTIHHMDVIHWVRQSKMYTEVSRQLAARSAGTVWWRKSFSTRNLAILHHENQYKLMETQPFP